MPELVFERLSPLRRRLRGLFTESVANYTPAAVLRALLRFAKSELAASNWANPGGWRSMVLSYQPRPRQVADRIMVRCTMPMALRNRRRLAAHLLAQRIDASPQRPVHVLCLGAGPGTIILDALSLANAPAHATLVDLSSDAFDFGLRQAAQRGLADKVRYIQADIRDLSGYLDPPPHVVKMIGICEYLSDEQIVAIARAAAGLMAEGTSILFNSMSRAHGTDRFLRRVFGLHMNHRTPAHLQGLLARAGFGRFVTHPEPLGVFHVIVGRKVG